jgi:acetyl esterase
MVTLKHVHLEKSTEDFIDQLTAKGGPPIYKLTPIEARAVLESVQSSPIAKPEVKIEEKKIPCGPKGEVSIRIYRPKNAVEKLPVILYFHGAGWVMGSADTHDRLVRELTVGSNAAVVFVNYSRSPEARFPEANEEAFAATQYIAEHGADFNLDVSHLSVVGDSVGGNMAIAVTLMAKERHGPKIDFQLLFYPVTSAELNTPSYHEFADGPWLTKLAMEWFWNAYEPSISARSNPLISPLRASIDQLKGLPPALIITDENDVLRDEGEEYAQRLMQAGVNVTAVRFLGTIHDFVMLNALAKTPASRGAIALANSFLHQNR